jgi:tetratricopeptide (TPR) repeat protein
MRKDSFSLTRARGSSTSSIETMDRSAALQPLDEAAEPTRRLVEHPAGTEPEQAIQQVAAAVDRSLREALRTDGSAAEHDRLAAPSPDAMALYQVVQSLRARDRISIETAGSVHELGAAAERARSGAVRPGDGDIARRAVERLRADLTTEAAPPAAADAADAAPAAPIAGGPGDGAGGDVAGGHASDPAGEERPPTRRPPVVRGGGRWVAWVGATLAVLFMIGLAWALAGGGNEDYDAGIAAFRAARWDSAAAAFERVLADRPVDVTSMLYLSRAYRRLGRMEEAAGLLREAARVASEDADVRRELGHLFMDLGQPGPAAQQYERAVQADPESAASWAGLIRALRSAGDPRAERVLDEAPPDVRESLGAPGR